ncbi:MaoC family dehydratase N-terminal domain-containing protein [Sphingomonas canadensis]|uniref:MaoC family dehydratase N-terminal domain-containing protein n=1 Tax=Sphingomonas canadensis TaxID=1219257 RepID=A0ABW3H448_9SPHN|nr:MaoC family dehydratase N-terminal domain-containing protein [Sphingomonas canadensis]MCW3834473.1 MaoC family dehydratase N-terminal domain-containing protein [Sphingomonas canadensis]
MTAQAFDRALIGRRSEPSVVRVDTAQLKFFAKATDQRDPVYFDEAAARAAGHRAIPVPPTFAFSLSNAAPEQAAYGLVQVRADVRYLLHAEQGFNHYATLYAEDEVTITTQILDLYEKKGGALRFIAQRTDLANKAGILCIECDSTFVLRAPAPGA